MSLFPRLMLIAALALSGTGLAQPAAAQAANCSRATQPTERAICATPRLRDLDRRIAASYRALLSGMDADDAKALRDDQRGFIALRDLTSATGPGLDLELEDSLTARADFLDSLTAAPPEGLLGRWRNLSGEITVIQWATGVLTFNAQSADPVAGRWVCDAKGDGEWTGPEEAMLDIKNEPGDPQWKLVVTRQGAVLKVDEQFVSGERQKPYCGFNGSLSGTYFRVAGSTDASR